MKGTCTSGDKRPSRNRLVGLSRPLTRPAMRKPADGQEELAVATSGYIGPIDPHALKIPARRAESLPLGEAPDSFSR